PLAAARGSPGPMVPENLVRGLHAMVSTSSAGPEARAGPSHTTGAVTEGYPRSATARPPSFEGTGTPRSAIQGGSPTHHRRRTTRARHAPGRRGRGRGKVAVSRGSVRPGETSASDRDPRRARHLGAAGGRVVLLADLGGDQLG